MPSTNESGKTTFSYTPRTYAVAWNGIPQARHRKPRGFRKTDSKTLLSNQQNDDVLGIESRIMVRLRQGKNKRWRKGQSCESNPETRTHRDAAKRGAIVGHATRNSNLTVDALARHEEKHDEEGDFALKDEEGLSVKSGQTFGAFSVSGLTDCSNPAFATVRRFWDSPSSQHKEVS